MPVGIAILNFESGYGLGYALLHGLFGGLGYLLAIVLMAGVQERIEFSRVPESMKGLPITLVSASTIDPALKGQLDEATKTGAAQLVGKLVAERALNAGIKDVVFDRGGYLYTGRVAALAADAREAGLNF